MNQKKTFKGKQKEIVYYDYQKHRERYEKNSEKIKLYARQRYQITKEKKLKDSKQWRIANAQRHSKLKQNWIKRRMFYQKAMMLKHRKRAGTITEKPKHLAWLLCRIWIRQKGLCAISGVKLGRDAQLDHIIPVARCGTNDLTNLQFLAPEINQAKSSLLMDEFIEMCRRVVNKCK